MDDILYVGAVATGITLIAMVIALMVVDAVANRRDRR
jgi:hypothetical protein